jgi:hypothetical protein
LSEQNILNPSQTSLFSPDWGYTEGLQEVRTIFQAASGNIFQRQQSGLGRVYALGWNSRDLATKHALQQWENQYRDDYFTLADWERARYFTGRFAAPLTFSPHGNQQYDIKGSFLELPGLPMYAYPANWARDAFFLEERNSKGEDLVNLTGAWTYSVDARWHGGASYYSNVTNNLAEWLYFGYGFQYWAPTSQSSGILEYTLTRVRDGAVMAGPTLFDQYSALTQPSAMLFAVPNLPLDFYRLKLRVTGTKNVSATDYVLWADAVQVMR